MTLSTFPAVIVTLRPILAIDRNAGEAADKVVVIALPTLLKNMAKEDVPGQGMPQPPSGSILFTGSLPIPEYGEGNCW